MTDLFVVMRYDICDDNFYGYNENLDRIFGSFEEAKTYVDTLMIKNPNWFDGLDNNSFIHIILMTMGEKRQEILYRTDPPEDDEEK